ncbi:MAG TPA: NfeD family protein [Gaiellaceae bacterium]|jgi:membrane protein implicated in regulation of membrane protease activity|nr:NfeD family protein [Gaiellaceae bacterium]
MPAWVAWAIVAVLLAVGEIFTPGLFFLGPIALAALASTVVAAVGGPVWLQIAVFGAGSFAAVGLLRPIARNHLTMPRAIRTGAAALEGATAVVLQRVDSRGGRVKIGGEEWSARSYVPDEEFDVGTEVEVAQIQGATALVYR